MLCRYAFICLSYEDQHVTTPLDKVDPNFLLLPGANSHMRVDDSYCLALYNDEAHTYEAVSSAITRSVGCAPNIAMDYTLKVDNLGRALIKFGNYEVIICSYEPRLLTFMHCFRPAWRERTRCENNSRGVSIRLSKLKYFTSKLYACSSFRSSCFSGWRIG